MSKNILIVEDDVQLGETLFTMLELLGHRPTLCATVDRAFELITEDHWDVILSDYSLGTGTGADIMSRASAIQSRARLIISSGYDRDQFEEELQHLQQIHWINKPYKIEELMALLK